MNLNLSSKTRGRDGTIATLVVLAWEERASSNYCIFIYRYDVVNNYCFCRKGFSHENMNRVALKKNNMNSYRNTLHTSYDIIIHA